MPDQKDKLLTAKIDNLGVRCIQRHILLCCDQTKPKCCDKDESLVSWNYLKRRLVELRLIGQSALDFFDGIGELGQAKWLWQ